MVDLQSWVVGHVFNFDLIVDREVGGVGHGSVLATRASLLVLLAVMKRVVSYCWFIFTYVDCLVVRRNEKD